VGVEVRVVRSFPVSPSIINQSVIVLVWQKTGEFVKKDQGSAGLAIFRNASSKPSNPSLLMTLTA
jgi:hypothetical protein